MPAARRNQGYAAKASCSRQPESLTPKGVHTTNYLGNGKILSYLNDYSTLGSILIVPNTSQECPSTRLAIRRDFLSQLLAGDTLVAGLINRSSARMVDKNITPQSVTTTAAEAAKSESTTPEPRRARMCFSDRTIGKPDETKRKGEKQAEMEPSSTEHAQPEQLDSTEDTTAA